MVDHGEFDWEDDVFDTLASMLVAVTAAAGVVVACVVAASLGRRALSRSWREKDRESGHREKA